MQNIDWYNSRDVNSNSNMSAKYMLQKWKYVKEIKMMIDQQLLYLEIFYKNLRNWNNKNKIKNIKSLIFQF